MHDRINNLLAELYGADPALKAKESILRPLLHELLTARPDVVMDAAFRNRLKLQLISSSALQRSHLAGWRGMRLYYGIGTAALIVVLVFAARPDPSVPPGQVAFKAIEDSAAPADVPATEAGNTMTMTAAREAATTMQLTSDAFAEGQPIPAQYTCDGSSLTPPLTWSGVPDDAKSLALVLHDPDAPRDGGFTHWVVYDIPAHGASTGGTDGANGTGKTGYVGPCPPSGAHRYVFTLYALDAVLGLKEGTDRPGFLAAAEGHVLATVQLVGTYLRK